MTGAVRCSRVPQGYRTAPLRAPHGPLKGPGLYMQHRTTAVRAPIDVNIARTGPSRRHRINPFDINTLTLLSHSLFPLKPAFSAQYRTSQLFFDRMALVPFQRMGPQFVPPERLHRARIAELNLQLDRLHYREQYVVAALLADEWEEARARRRRRTCWVKPWLQRRVLLGQYDTLMHELMRESHGDFKNYMRTDLDMFREMLARVAPRITKSIESRPPIRAGLKLAVTLRFLATGNSYKSLSYDFRVAHNTIALFVPEVCNAIVEEYRLEQFSTPSNPDGWKQVAAKFGNRWNFPHCCGSIDGKHVAIRKPEHAGSLYYNYKGFHSILMLALVEADYKFLWVNVGAEGSNSDAGVFQRCNLETALREGTLGLPDPDPLPNDDRDTPYFMVGRRSTARQPAGHRKDPGRVPAGRRTVHLSI